MNISIVRTGNIWHLIVIVFWWYIIVFVATALLIISLINSIMLPNLCIEINLNQWYASHNVDSAHFDQQ